MEDMRCKTRGFMVCWFVLGCGSTSSNDGGDGGASTGTTGSAANVGGSANGSTSSTGSGGVSSGGSGAGTLATSSPGGASARGAAGVGGTSAGGASSGGNGGSSGSSGASGEGGGASGGNGGTAGAGGDPADCTVPFTGPIGGPRSDGPEPLLTPCDQLSDEVILARYKDFDQKTPQGLYWEPPGIVSWWEEPCSESLDETLERSSERQLGEVDGQSSSDWSHQVSGCYGDSRRVYSNISCDYFDGTQLANGNGQELAYLASLLWWMDHGNVTG